jgi:hypothetical protein
MTATLMDGKALAIRLRAEVAREVAAFGRPIGLATVLVGDDPASEVYIRLKHKASLEVGIQARDLRLPASTSEEELLSLVAELNADDAVDGILIQLPLPDGLDEGRVINAIDPLKDVDGIHPLNGGLLLAGTPAHVPGTPLGVLSLDERRRAPRRKRDRDRPQQHRREAGGVAPAAPARDRHGLPLAHAGPRGGDLARRRDRRRSRRPRARPGRDGEGGRGRDRRRNHPDGGRTRR